MNALSTYTTVLSPKISSKIIITYMPFIRQERETERYLKFSAIDSETVKSVFLYYPLTF